MKLIRCHIENFGGLSDYDLEFAPGLTVIREENGFGKTTLAEFIRAMFYGLPRKTPKALGKRQKYEPWQGGKYGGSLTFEHDGKEYRIQRTFGATPKSDTFALIDLQTGEKSGAFSDSIGLELFGLDADSFERSTYLPQNRDGGPLSTDSIQAKLGGLVEDENDVGGYEKAVKKLEEKRKTYCTRSATSPKGTVPEAAKKILEIREALAHAETCARDLTEAEQTIARLETEQGDTARRIEEVRQELTAANEAAARLAHHQQLERLEKAHRKAAGELETLKDQYPKGIPGQEELTALTDAVERLASLPPSPVTAADQEAQRFVEENQSRFAQGAPTEDQIAEMRRTCDEYRSLSAQRDACAVPAEEAAELERIRGFLAPGVPEEDTLARQMTDLEEAERLRRENMRLASVPGGEAAKKASPLAPILMGLGGVAVLAGIVLFVMNQTAPGGIALGLGLIALAAAVYLTMQSALNRQTTALDPRVQALIQENDARAAELEAAVRSFAAPYGAEVRQIREQTARLHILEKREQDLLQRQEQLTKKMDACNESLRAFLDRYLHPGYRGGGYELLARIQRESDQWERAQQQLKDRDARVERYQRENREIRQVLEGVWNAYALAPRSRDQVLRLRDDARQMTRLEQDIQLLTRQIREYRADHEDTLAAPVPHGAADPGELRKQERELLDKQGQLGAELLRSRRRQEELFRGAEEIPQLQDQLIHWQERKAADEARVVILDDALAFLEQAKTDLALSYMMPIRESFAGLMSRMAGEQPEKILVTPELVVCLERGGESRKLDYFSAGQTDLVMLCMRLALVDAMFREVKPFVILDDPFVNLDDRHTAQALELLRELARDRQIVYLTCNSSRT